MEGAPVPVRDLRIRDDAGGLSSSLKAEDQEQPRWRAGVPLCLAARGVPAGAWALPSGTGGGDFLYT